jgi:adenylate cyclase
LILYLVDQGNLKEIKKPVFSIGDTYILDDDKTIYVWIGSKCSVDEKTAGAAQARTLDQQRGGAAKIITIDQNQETSDFMKSINNMGAMKVVEKNYAKTLLKDVSTGDFAGFSEWKNVLYRVSAEEFDGINTMKMIQVPFAKDSLDSEDAFIADLGNKVYIWQGSTSQR